MNSMIQPLISLWDQAVSIWMSGGWAMIAIAAISLLMFSLGIHVYMKLASKQVDKVREQTWRHWIDHPDEREGYVGKVLNFVTGGKSLKDTAAFFEELRSTEILPFERDLKVMKICASAAPLLGLLGTVTGMLATFSALATGSGGDKTMESVASGISEALVTTETGLIIALPGVFAHYILVRKLEKYKALLAHIETVCTQKQYKKLKRQKHSLLNIYSSIGAKKAAS